MADATSILTIFIVPSFTLVEPSCATVVSCKMSSVLGVFPVEGSRFWGLICSPAMRAIAITSPTMPYTTSFFVTGFVVVFRYHMKGLSDS